MALVMFENYAFQYALGQKPALHDVSFSVREGAFIVVFGRSGSGKSTLLRCMKPDITPPGQTEGRLSTTLPSRDIAIVFQDPDTQLICHSVLEDLVFHMENLGYEPDEMQKRLAETVHYFGLEALLNQNPNEISGGQKQLLALCAALMTRPRLLLLDEPVSQLDPVAARAFFQVLAQVNEDFKVTIVMSAHRLDEAVTVADELAFMSEGRLVRHGETRTVCRQMLEAGESPLFVPSIPRLAYRFGMKKLCLSPKEFIRSEFENNPKDVWKSFERARFMNSLQTKESSNVNLNENSSLNENSNEAIITLHKFFYAYDKQHEFVLKDLNLQIDKGERLCLLGGNGSGKSTLLRLVARILKPNFGAYQSGKLKIGYLPQNLKLFFRFRTVLDEITFGGQRDLDEGLLDQFGLADYLACHPYDLSGGEAAKLALLCVLQQQPDLIVLDEPTKGLDPYAKEVLMELLGQSNGTVLCATHDLEFAARFATRCAMLFNGAIAYSDKPREFFRASQYYTTPVHLATRSFAPNLFLYEDVCRG